MSNDECWYAALIYLYLDRGWMDWLRDLKRQQNDLLSRTNDPAGYPEHHTMSLSLWTGKSSRLNGHEDPSGGYSDRGCSCWWSPVIHGPGIKCAFVENLLKILITLWLLQQEDKKQKERKDWQLIDSFIDRERKWGQTFLLSEWLKHKPQHHCCFYTRNLISSQIPVNGTVKIIIYTFKLFL